MNCIVSYIASPAVIDPPGLLMYSWMSLSGSSASEEQHLRDHEVGNLVVDRRADEDDAVFEQPRKDVVARSPRLVCSTTIGTSCPAG
jgi:hypothetical protein